VVQTIKSPPATQETQVQSLGQEDPLEKGILQYSCLDNSMNGGAWPATVYGVTKSWARSETEHACMSWAEGGTGNGREAGFRSPSLNPGVGLGPGLLLERTTSCPIDWTDSVGEIR